MGGGTLKSDLDNPSKGVHFLDAPAADFAGKQGILLGAFVRDPFDASFTKCSFVSLMKPAACSSSSRCKSAGNSGEDWGGMQTLFDEYADEVF